MQTSQVDPELGGGFTGCTWVSR